jgi:hypothetical protein
MYGSVRADLPHHASTRANEIAHLQRAVAPRLRGTTGIQPPGRAGVLGADHRGAVARCPGPRRAPRRHARTHRDAGGRRPASRHLRPRRHLGIGVVGDRRRLSSARCAARSRGGDLDGRPQCVGEPRRAVPVRCGGRRARLARARRSGDDHPGRAPRAHRRRRSRHRRAAGGSPPVRSGLWRRAPRVSPLAASHARRGLARPLGAHGSLPATSPRHLAPSLIARLGGAFERATTRFARTVLCAASRSSSARSPRLAVRAKP